MSPRHYLVTGGTGFLGSALVRRLVRAGHRVRVLDNGFRGAAARLGEAAAAAELITGDIRDPAAVAAAVQGVDSVCHLAFVNGTEYFYTRPELVLEVGVKGMTNVLDACVEHGVGELILASSSEVYQTPPVVPTPEGVPLSVPDPLNPRYSYGGGKIISELLALNYGRKLLDRVVIFRPHNVYGPAMGWEHVLPQFVLRLHALAEDPRDPLPFPIQGSGTETRSFIEVEDFIDGVELLLEKGEHRGIYHIGTMEELSILDVVQAVGAHFGRRLEVVPGALRPGGTPRRCPEIAKMRALGFAPRIPFEEGLGNLARWYVTHAAEAPEGAARVEGKD